MAFKAQLTSRPKEVYNDENLSCVFIPGNDTLPTFKESPDGVEKDKSFKVPSYFQLSQIIGYLFNNQNVKDFLLIGSSDSTDPCDHLDLALEVDP